MIRLRPQRFPVGVLVRQRLQLGDHRRGPATGDLGFRLGGVGDDLVLHQRGGERIDELKVAQIVEDRPAPFLQRRRQMLTGLFEPARGGGVHARRLLRDEPAQIASVLGNGEPVTGWGRGQHHARVHPGAADQLAQVGHVGVDAGPRPRRRPFLPERGDQRVDPDRPVAIDDEHGQHRPLFGGAQWHQRAADAHFKWSEHTELETYVHRATSHSGSYAAIDARAGHRTETSLLSLDLYESFHCGSCHCGASHQEVRGSSRY